MGSCPLQQRRMIGHFIVDFSAQKGFELVVAIPLGGFEPPSPDPKSCMIDRYTTGVFDHKFRKGDLCTYHWTAMLLNSTSS